MPMPNKPITVVLQKEQRPINTVFTTYAGRNGTKKIQTTILRDKTRCGMKHASSFGRCIAYGERVNFQPSEICLLACLVGRSPTFDCLMFYMSMCSDPYFASVIPASANPTWLVSRYASYTREFGLTGPPSYVINNPYSICIAFMTVAARLGARTVSLVNSYGRVVRPIFDVISSSYNERVVVSSQDASGKVTYRGTTDISLARGERTWPLMFPISLMIAKTHSVQSCAARAEVGKFLRWMMRASSSRYTLAAGEYSALLSDEADQQLGVTKTIMNLECATEKIEDGTYEAIIIAGRTGPTPHTSFISVALQSFSQHDAVAEYSYITQDEGVAMENVINPGSRPDAVWHTPLTFGKLYPEQKKKYVDTDMVIMMPLGFYAITPHFRLPDSVLVYIKKVGEMPLKLDLETLASIYLGDITSWADSRIVAFNPSLPAAYGALDSSITLILCGDGKESVPLANHLVLALNQTDAFQQSGITFTLPVDWTPVTNKLDAKGVKYILMQHELQLENTIDRIVGGLGYFLTYQPVPNPSTDMSIVKTINFNNGTFEQYTVAPTNQSYFKIAELIEPTSEIADFEAVFESQDAMYRDIWPIPLITALGVTKTTSTSNDLSLTATAICWRTSRAIKFAYFLATDDSMAAPSTRCGRETTQRLPNWRAFFDSRLRECTCQGEPVLFVRPIIWSFPDSVANFGRSVGGIGLLMIVLCVLVIWYFRHRTIVKSANLILQFISLAGQTMLLLGCVVFTLEPTIERCNAVGWLLVVGASAALSPLCLKMLRVYRTFSQRRGMRKMAKLTNRKLQLLSGAWIAAHVIIMIVAPGKNGGLLTPTTTVLFQSSRDNYYTQCSLSSGALPHAAVILVMEGFALIGCSIIAFGIRHVSSAFNESRNITWAIWNVVLSSLIVIPILLITGGMHSDIGVFLIEFLVLWCTLSTLVFTFGWKFYSIFQEELEVRRANLSTSSGSHNSSTGRDTTGSNTGTSDATSLLTFPSLEGASLPVLEKYITAIETQIRMARAKRKEIFGVDSQVPMGGVDNVNWLPGKSWNHRSGVDEKSIISGDHDQYSKMPPPAAPMQPTVITPSALLRSRPAAAAALTISTDSVPSNRRQPSNPIVRQPIRIGNKKTSTNNLNITSPPTPKTKLPPHARKESS
jgi:hypothetical protein